MAVATMAAALNSSVASAQGISRDSVPPGLITYEVVPGDTLSGIAQSFKISPETILWANGMSNGDLIAVGQKLTILPVSGVLHKVAPGESVLGIAAAYGVDPAKIVETNQIADPALVRVGDLLIVPGAARRPGPPAPIQAAPRQGATSYTVKPGDTLFSIATAFGVQVAALRAANGLGGSDLLRIGQQLSIPGAAQQESDPQEEQPGPAERETSSRGDQHEARSFIATITAYTIQGGTATGSRTHWGTVAVDPRVIPLGSRLRIDGFDEIFVAEDTGGGVRGNWIDIWFPDHMEALRFGIQSRRVTIIEP